MNLNLLVLRTRNPKGLSSFYEQLGVKFEYHQHGNGAWHYSSDVEGIVFEIYPLLRNQKNVDKSLRLGFSINNLDKKIIKLQQLGIEIVSLPKRSEWGYFAVIKDLDGRKIELKEK